MYYVHGGNFRRVSLELKVVFQVLDKVWILLDPESKNCPF